MKRTPAPANPAPANANQLVGRRIAALRRKLGISATELAQRVGVKKRQQWSYERGETGVTAGTLFLIAQTLGVSVDEFFCDFDDPPPNTPA